MKDKKIKPTSIGGQAVIEGVMMRGPSHTAICVRKSDGTIESTKEENGKLIEKLKLRKIPLLRGLVSFFESMVIGIKAITYSANFFDVEEDTSDETKTKEKKEDEKLSPWIIFTSIILALGFSVGVFILLPNFISSLIIPKESTVLYNISEAIIRILLFLAYLYLVTLLEDIRRVFEYHGAEHKTIFCYEYGEELTVENVKKQSRFHPRCGTSFLVFVMIVSIIIFSLIGRNENVFINMANRLLALPLVAGVAYEIIRFAGRSKSKLVGILIKPGLWLQRLTTKEPDDSQIEVAIESLKMVMPENKDDAKW